MKCMIFAAGLGTRLKPITDTMPKALVPIGGKPLLQWQLEKLYAAGIRNVVINVHHFPEQIIVWCKENVHNMHIQFSDESAQLLETGGGLRKAGNLLAGDEPILVLNVDVLSNISLEKVIAAYNPSDLAMLVVSGRATQRYFLFDEANHLKGWTNIATGEVKPIALAQQSVTNLKQLAFSGMHVVSPAIFRKMESWPEKFPIVDFYLKALEDNTISAYVPDNYRMMDIGKIDHLDEAQTFAASLA